MRIAEAVQQPDAPSGVFGDVVRELGHELVRWSAWDGSAPPEDVDAAMTFGGAMNVDEEDGHPWLRTEKEWLAGLIDRGVPLLGVCLGSQLVAEVAGAEVGRAPEPEIGWYEVELTPEAAGDPLLGAAPPSFCALEWHSYRFRLPPGGIPLARRDDDNLQAFRVGDSTWGIQFHAEVTSQILGGWIAEYDSDPDAVRMGVDPEAFLAESERRIGAWNEFGRALAGRFVEAAATRPVGAAPPRRSG